MREAAPHYPAETRDKRACNRAEKRDKRTCIVHPRAASACINLHRPRNLCGHRANSALPRALMRAGRGAAMRGGGVAEIQNILCFFDSENMRFDTIWQHTRKSRARRKATHAAATSAALHRPFVRRRAASNQQVVGHHSRSRAKINSSRQRQTCATMREAAPHYPAETRDKRACNRAEKRDKRTCIVHPRAASACINLHRPRNLCGHRASSALPRALMRAGRGAAMRGGAIRKPGSDTTVGEPRRIRITPPDEAAEEQKLCRETINKILNKQKSMTFIGRLDDYLAGNSCLAPTNFSRKPALHESLTLEARAKRSEEESKLHQAEVEKLREGRENSWQLEKENFLKSKEFDSLCSKKASVFFDKGFDGCLAQFRAKGYSEEEHPASFLDVEQALADMSDDEDVEESVSGSKRPRYAYMPNSIANPELDLYAELVGFDVPTRVGIVMPSWLDLMCQQRQDKTPEQGVSKAGKRFPSRSIQDPSAGYNKSSSSK
ncbi:hypothetical protein F511_43319 [Dorcoceras hygrometricum]|uniref:Uncharacterized protein n=1 Tax=Dorcoceras hygrometricum TaxID=472368 RepID=A0A2Z7CEE6_9LAMI|nr:hypothetical protein F511_43319 [Dorcoceras hygrometricum]